ncbi:SDR family NAD(P)-dependent oxidoreductase [Streptosporangium sp. NBC_01755]|uniref:SDR family NAD(P)-dependent oxidoreductase n=1 Tax=Streptosporangium sp. NBC_01755 TaxID=2975949 RepID=UPI002DD8967F|nr:SDR family NAD(P)-dependent oxidoreductase [Streptosporangium sp. NBC_01755]WSD02686.1 SDR family NAD(P)-dependent oxidoreductase [Streptosporangium sp. NBC_01755]
MITSGCSRCASVRSQDCIDLPRIRPGQTLNSDCRTSLKKGTLSIGESVATVSSAEEPLAIVGAGCRLPGGVEDLDGLWGALTACSDLVTEVPNDRFDPSWFVHRGDRRSGRSYTAHGAFLDDLAGFDPGYFGISPREADRLDPQQRLMLELAVESLDDAGIDPARLAGSDTAVFIGVFNGDYGVLQGRNPASLNAYSVAGWTFGNTANRVSYFLDLHGPSMAIDTACSSALVALHEAAQAIRSGECRVALAGGVNVLLDPAVFVGLSQASMLSKRGRCQTFSANADGYVRGEGAGMVVLKTLADARADGDRVHALLLRTGTNTDGRTEGLTHPGVGSQAALLRDVYARAAVDLDDLVYWEAHGTGTPVGDPVECEAIGQAIGIRRSPGNPLPIGSIKSNMGHLESAAGMAGLLKAILVLRHGVIPPNLHADPLNPGIDWNRLGLSPVTRERAIRSVSRPLAGVSSFGFGGVNAHAVLAVPPPVDVSARTPAPLLPVVVSGRTAAAAKDMAARVADRLDSTDSGGFYDVCHTLARRRGVREHRISVLAAGAAEAASLLREVVDDENPVGTASDSARTDGRVVFAFGGAGTPWPGMARDLLAGDEAFRSTVERIDRLLSRHVGWSVVTEMTAPASHSRLNTAEIGQPALFAVQMGLVAALQARGIRPAAVIGHSVGEIAAACVSGALDLEDAVLLCAARGRTQQLTMGEGAMAAVGLSPAQAAEELEPFGAEVELAAINSGRDVTVAGSRDALRHLESVLVRKGVFFRRLDVEFAFHSRAMDRLETPLLKALEDLRPAIPGISLVSTVTGLPVEGAELDSAYWWQNVRQAVRFGPAVDLLVRDGYQIFLEVGPHPVLQTYLRRAGEGRAGEEGARLTVLPTLRREQPGEPALRTAVAALLAAGADADWEAFLPQRGSVAELPTYPWQRERHWNGQADWWAPRLEHPLLGARIPAPDPSWNAPIDPGRVPWLTEHRVAGADLLPATGFVELALAAGRRILDGPLELLGLEILRPLPVPSAAEPDLDIQVCVTQDGQVRVSTRSDDEWQVHARCRVRAAVDAPPVPLGSRPPLDDVVEVGADEHFAVAARAGLDYGPVFRSLKSVLITGETAHAEYRFTEPTGGYEAHPAIVDAALQTVLTVLAQRGSGVEITAHLPVSFDRVRLWRPPTATGSIQTRLRPQDSSRDVIADFTLTDPAGNIVMQLSGCRFRRMPGEEGPARHVTVLRASGGGPTAQDTTPAIADLLAVVEPHRRELRDRLSARSERHSRFMKAYTAVAAHFTMAMVHELVPAGQWSIEDLTAIGVLPKYTRLVRQLCVLAAGEGLCGDAGSGRWRTTGRAEPYRLFTAALGEFPEYSAELQLAGRCGRYLTDVLTGRREATEVLFPQGGLQTAEHFYDSGPVLSPCNLLARTIISDLVGLWPADRPLRVLEVGAGTGGLTAAVLPLLPPERTSYVFTDLSSAFLKAAAARFKPYDFVDYKLLDLERNPADQGFAEAGFDLVLAANVLHATADLGRTLDAVSALLDDGGLLLMGETLHIGPLALVFGLLDGWWSATDTARRPGGPLLGADAWLGLLAERGFTESVELRAEEEPVGIDTTLFLAARQRRPLRAHENPAPPSTADWWVLAESPNDQEFAEVVARELERAGQTASACAGDPPHGGTDVVFLLGGGHGTADDDPDASAQRVAAATEALRSCAAIAQRSSAGRMPMVWLVTRPSGVFPAPERPLFPGDAALWGAARCLANEEPDVAVRKVSFDRGADQERDAKVLVSELLGDSPEDEVVLTRGGRFVPRLKPASDPPVRPGEPRRLRIRNHGPAYRLDWEPAPTRVPGPNEVTVEVRAAGVNYRNVLRALGRLPDEAAGGPNHESLYGFDCAGVVTEVGADVRDLRPGDRVFAGVPNALASLVVVDRRCVSRIPDGMDYTAAATLPVAFLTVRLALADRTMLSQGEVVLLHGATGGVGLAALQHARLVGAKVIATAGTADKRDLLRALGVEHVLDSRGLGFAGEVMAITGGRGVDVVLNSLAGEGLVRGLELLRPRGRFVELGKQDFHAGTRLAMSALSGNINFLSVDLMQVLQQLPEVTQSSLNEVAELVEAGAYQPLPYRAFPADRVAESFDLMKQSRHIGKIVLTFEPAAPAVGARRAGLDPEAVYLVSGGLGGFGARTAQWLAEQGAGRLALIGRRGLDGPEARKTVRSLEQRGVTVTAHAVDVSDMQAMRTLVAEIDATGHRLGGVVHCAMVLDDAPLTELTRQRLRAVLAPKLSGALVLDRLTRERSLDLFVVYSSVTAAVGNIGQAGYAAGNLFGEALVRARRARGQAGLAVAWGSVGDVGYLARNAEAEAVMARWTRPVEPGRGLDVMGSLMELDTDVALVGAVDWEDARALLPTLDAPRFSPVRSAVLAGRPEDLREQIMNAASAEAETLVTDTVTRLLAEVLQAAPQDVAASRPLNELGIDSLMRAELQGAIWRSLGCDIPVMAIGPAASATDLAKQVLTRLSKRLPTATGSVM